MFKSKICLNEKRKAATTTIQNTVSTTTHGLYQCCHAANVDGDSQFGLKMPIHAPFWVVFGGFDPLDETQYQPILQKFHLLIIAVPAVYYLCWCL